MKICEDCRWRTRLMDLLASCRRSTVMVSVRDCVHHVESLTASPHLTEAVILLGKAREKVADFIENVPVIEQAAPSVSVEREALARTIAQNIDLDWGAHNLSDLTDEAHDNEEDACPACSKVADALLSRYSIQEKGYGSHHGD